MLQLCPLLSAGLWASAFTPRARSDACDHLLRRLVTKVKVDAPMPRAGPSTRPVVRAQQALAAAGFVPLLEAAEGALG